MIRKRKLPGKPYYKVYDSEFPYVIVYCTLEEAETLILYLKEGKETFLQRLY